MSQIRSSYTDSINFYGGHSPLDLAQQFGTPLYVYNETVLRQRCRELKALSSLPGFGVNYSVKANTNPVLLRIIREEGLVVDAMSPGELYMDQLAGFTADESDTNTSKPCFCARMAAPVPLSPAPNITMRFILSFIVYRDEQVRSKR